MIKRTQDATFLNSILNHPAVYPWVCGVLTTPIDLSAAVVDEKNILLQADFGAFLFIGHGNHVYEIHTQFLPEGHGTAYPSAQEALVYMFQTDCEKLITYVPRGNEAAKKLAERCGFSFRITDGEWLLHGNKVPMDHFELTKADWICQQQQ